MNLQLTSIASDRMEPLPLPSRETDGMETWKEHCISQQVCKAEFEKPLQKPAHSDLCNWCLSQRRAKPPGNSVDQAPWTKRMGQKFPTAGKRAGLLMWEAGGGGGGSKNQSNSCWYICPSLSPWNSLPLHHIKAKAGFKVTANLPINSNVSGAKQRGASSLRASSSSIQTAPTPPQSSGIKGGDPSATSNCNCTTFTNSKKCLDAAFEKVKIGRNVFTWKPSLEIISVWQYSYYQPITYFLSTTTPHPGCKRPRERLYLLKIKTTLPP